MVITASQPNLTIRAEYPWEVALLDQGSCSFHLQFSYLRPHLIPSCSFLPERYYFPVALPNCSNVFKVQLLYMDQNISSLSSYFRLSSLPF